MYLAFYRYINCARAILKNIILIVNLYVSIVFNKHGNKPTTNMCIFRPILGLKIEKRTFQF